jgi:hypothetical protein
MGLTNDEQKQLAYAQEVKAFISSEAWAEFVWPTIMQLVNKEFPKPDGPGWEQKYVHAYALVECANTMKSTLMNIADQVDHLKKKEVAVEPDIDLA